MDPFTAALIISVVVAGISGYVANENNNDQIKQQNKLMDQQEQARQDQVRAEVGAASQRTQTALTGASKRNNGVTGSSFASVLGGMPSVSGSEGGTTSTGSSGTF